MNDHLLTEGAPNSNPAVTDKVSRKRLRERAMELAALDGRAPQDAGKSDWEMAKVELSGEPEVEPEPKAPRDSAAPTESGSAIPLHAPTPGWLS